MTTLGRWRRRFLVLEAIVAVTLAQSAVACLPIRWVLRARSNRSVEAEPSTNDQDEAKRIAHAMGRVERRLPWRSPCLARALAARFMLRRRGVASVLHFGVVLSQGPDRSMTAHAWLTVGPVGVVGVAEAEGFSEIAGFS